MFYLTRRNSCEVFLISQQMKKIVFIVVIGFACLSADLPSGAIKKMDKTIQSLWENQVVKKEIIDLSTQQNAPADLQLNKLLVNNKLVAFLAISRAKSRVDFFDYMIIYNPDLSIKTIQVLAYREDYGGEIASNRWLKQFTGKKNAEEMKFGQDIQGISGATVSARSLTADVQEVSKFMYQLNSKGVI